MNAQIQGQINIDIYIQGSKAKIIGGYLVVRRRIDFVL